MRLVHLRSKHSNPLIDSHDVIVDLHQVYRITAIFKHDEETNLDHYLLVLELPENDTGKECYEHESDLRNRLFGLLELSGLNELEAKRIADEFKIEDIRERQKSKEKAHDALRALKALVS